MNTYHVYAIVNRGTLDAYVGSTKRLNRRWQEHQWALGLGRHPSRQLQQAWNQYGASAFEFVIIWSLVDSSREGAKLAELYWLSVAGTYNDIQADLAAGTFRVTPERRLIMSEQALLRSKTPEFRAAMTAHTKRRWADPELRKPMLKGLKNDNQFSKGTTPRKTAEMDAAHSEHMKAVWADPEKRSKLKARQEARWLDPEAKARQADKMRAYHAKRRAT